MILILTTQHQLFHEKPAAYQGYEYELLKRVAYKKLAAPQYLSIFLLLGVGIIFVSLVYYTFETLFIIGTIYFFVIPLSFFIFKNKMEKFKKLSQEDDPDDIL